MSRQTGGAPRDLPTIVAILAGATFLGFGVLMFLAPRSAFDAVATFEPYNRHFLHDIGAFQIGLGTVLLAAVWMRDGLAAALTGVGTGATVHLISHVIDRDLGGEPARDIPVFAVTAAALVIAAVNRARSTGS